MFRFENTYARDLEGLYVEWQGDRAPAPQIVLFNDALADELGVQACAVNTPEGAAILSGGVAPEGASPLAQAYAGHQFGGFSPQLGDGRAILLGEIIRPDGARVDLHLKGSGRTPFSRGGDGKAVLGPVLREYLMGEAMHALGVPTTRALAAVITGEKIYRSAMKQGAVLARVAASHVRVGTFQFFAARGDLEALRRLADYAIARHDPDLIETPDRYVEFLRAVIDRQARLVAQWTSIGFVHGVMNTDNMTISGETIDYGPCAFLDTYDEGAVFSSIDHGGRYAFGNQAAIAHWNLARLAETLVPLIDPDNSEAAIRQATEALDTFPQAYQGAWTNRMQAKLGLDNAPPGFIAQTLQILGDHSVDFTSFFRALSGAAAGQDEQILSAVQDPNVLRDWLDHWRAALHKNKSSPSATATAMEAVNPIYIPRNHLVENALEQAEAGDFGAFKSLLSALKTPYQAKPEFEAFTRPAPKSFGPYKTFCGT